MECEYCRQPVEKDILNCTNCGAGVVATTDVGGLMPLPKDEIVWAQPRAYKGYVVWGYSDYFTEIAVYQFWLGDKIIETIELSREMIKQFVPEHQDSIAFAWELFELTQGEEEVLRIAQQNYKGKHPATFDIKYVPTPREEYAEGMSRDRILQAVRAGERVFVF